MSVEVSIRNHSFSETGRTMLRTYTLEQPDGRQDIYRVDVIDGKPVIGELLKTIDPMAGLGDAVARVTKAMGFTPCSGCERRRQALNRIVPFGDKGGADL